MEATLREFIFRAGMVAAGQDQEDVDRVGWTPCYDTFLQPGFNLYAGVDDSLLYKPPPEAPKEEDRWEEGALTFHQEEDQTSKEVMGWGR